MRQSLNLLLVSIATLLVGAWLVGGRVALGIAVMALAIGAGAVALLREAEPERSLTASSVADVLQRARAGR
jgi:hypothetical protein